MIRSQKTRLGFRNPYVIIAIGILSEGLLGIVSGRAADGMLFVFGVPIAGITLYEEIELITERPQTRLGRLAGKWLCTLCTDGWILFSLNNAARLGVSKYGVEAANTVVKTSDSILPPWLRVILPEWIVLIIVLTIAVYVALD